MQKEHASLQNNYTFEAIADSCTQGGKLVHMLKSRLLCGLVTNIGVTGHRELLLVTLVHTADVLQSTPACYHRLLQIIGLHLI